MTDVAARADCELQMLGPMVDCAYRLGMAFGKAAEAENDRTTQLQLFDAFHRSFQSVRMGIRLSMSLRAGPKAAAAPAIARERLEREGIEREGIEPLEVERLESGLIERERDRDYEPVSLPRFLATLGVVAREAERLPADVTGQALPTLKGLLAQAAADPPAPPARPATAVDLLTRRPPARSSLLTSTSAPRPVTLSGPRLARPPPPRPR